MGLHRWVNWDVPAGYHDDDGCSVGKGGGAGGDSLPMPDCTSFSSLSEADTPCHLWRLLPPTFELPVGPPPAPTIDTELKMDCANDWPDLRWSTCHPEGELLAGLLSSSPAWDADVDKVTYSPIMTLPPLTSLLSSSIGRRTATTTGALPSPRHRLLQSRGEATLDRAAKLFMAPLVLRLPGGAAASLPSPGPIEVPHFILNEGGSSYDRRTPTSPTAVTWGIFEDDSDASSSEPTKGTGNVKVDTGVDVSQRVLAPSPRMSKAAVMAQSEAEVAANLVVVAQPPASSKKVLLTKRMKNESAGAVPRNEPPPDLLPVAAGTTLPLKVPAPPAPPPPRKRKQATFVSPVPSRFCHLCSRTAPAVRHVVCGALATSATCRKVVCDRCFSTAGPVGLGGHTFDTAVAAGNAWRCSHCVGNCPARAQCRNYTRTNERLRLARSATVGELAAGTRRGGEGRGRPSARIRCRVGAKVAVVERPDAQAPTAKRRRTRLPAATPCSVPMPQEPVVDAVLASTRRPNVTRQGATAAMVVAEETGRLLLAKARAQSIGGADQAQANLARPSINRRLF
ncbi:hypothetical protein MMPV_008945 [Pyropia vietnamensis]